MTKRFTHLKRLREETRMNSLAQARGFETAAKMVAELYAQGESLVALADLLRLTEHTLKNRMKEWCIEIRPKGGPNNKQIYLTQTLIDEIMRDGVPLVAQKMGVTQSRLHARMRDWLKTRRTDDAVGEGDVPI